MTLTLLYLNSFFLENQTFPWLAVDWEYGYRFQGLITDQCGRRLMCCLLEFLHHYFDQLISLRISLSCSTDKNHHRSLDHSHVILFRFQVILILFRPYPLFKQSHLVIQSYSCLPAPNFCEGTVIFGHYDQLQCHDLKFY